MSSESLFCRLVIGHESELLDEKTADGHTHRWSVFVRSPEGYPALVDRSYVRKVQFILHDSFPKPQKTVRNPPFEITETGYGGFTMLILVHIQHVSKSFEIIYDMQLSMEKHDVKTLEQLLEVKNPAKDVIDLCLKYGAKLSPRKEKAEKIKDKGDKDEKKKHKHSGKGSDLGSKTKKDHKNEGDGKEAKKHKSDRTDPKKDEVEPKAKKAKKDKVKGQALISVDSLFEVAPASDNKKLKPDKKAKPEVKSEDKTDVKPEAKVEINKNLNVDIGDKEMKKEGDAKGDDVRLKDGADMMNKVSELSSLPTILSPITRNQTTTNKTEVRSITAVTQEVKSSTKEGSTSELRSTKEGSSTEVRSTKEGSSTEVKSVKETNANEAKSGTQGEKSVPVAILELRKKLYKKIDVEKYKLPMLRKLNLDEAAIRRYERPIPLLTFDDQLSVSLDHFK